MDYIYLLLSMAFSALITVSGRLYNNKNQNVTNVTRLYSLMASIFAAIGWLVLWLTDFSFDARVLPYSAV